MSSGLTPLASQMAMTCSQLNIDTGRLALSCPWTNQFLTVRCVTVVPTTARLSASAAVGCTTSARRIRRTSLSVVTRGTTEPSLLEAVIYLNLCCQQSLTVDTFQSGFSAISRKENPPSRRPITRTLLNSVSC
ncbi:uncharacterized protein TNCV_4511711 [Trichonephila clavipes]|nr:uncharacterized protein TNCV_4511711 [Trichonephila clavipes]